MSKHLVATVASMGALEAPIGVQKPDFFYGDFTEKCAHVRTVCTRPSCSVWERV